MRTPARLQAAGAQNFLEMFRMTKLHHRAPPSNLGALPLFIWAETVERRPPIPFAAAWLRRRHPLSPARAALVARLAGLGRAVMS